MLKRRDVLQLAGGAATFAATSGLSEALADPPATGAPTPFANSQVVEAARALAAKPFVAPNADLPRGLVHISSDAYASIHAKPEALIWAKEPAGFVIEPLHRGFVYKTPVEINLVENGQARRLNYNASDFDFGRVNLNAPPKNLDFSGFRVLRRSDGGEPKEMTIFQGASFFRAVAPGQDPGVKARGLSIRVGDSRGEEIPFFRAFWIEKPTAAENALTIHALLDSPSVAGAYRFTLHPGGATIIDTECSLFPRVNIDNYGLAAMSATCLFCPVDRRGFDDIREAVAELTGVQMLTGADEWVWRPVANRAALQISDFIDENPKGFGFMQRNRRYDDFYDDLHHWERRPSLWIEPIGDWGTGSVELLEIPSHEESAQNIIAFWRSKAPLVKGQQANFAYRQFWCWSPPSSPAFAITSHSRGGRGRGAGVERFLVEFNGQPLADAARVSDIKVALTPSPGKIKFSRLFTSPHSKTCRLLFDLDPRGHAACELRLILTLDGAPITETWLYRWTP